VVRSERLIKLRDSWFSAKSILVERLNLFFFGVELSINYGDDNLTDFNETPNTKKGYQADKL
jgi:hypothetical protein